jgi:hypothetical protein
MLVINLFKKKKEKNKGGKKYGLIRSNWDPAGYPFPPSCAAEEEEE